MKIDLQQGLPAVGAEATADVGELAAAQATDQVRHAVVAPALDGRHVRNFPAGHEAGAGDEIRLVVKDGRDQVGNVLAVELSVAVHVDHDVKTVNHGVFHRVPESLTQPLVDLVANDNSSSLVGQTGGFVGAAVVHHKNPPFVDPLKRRGNLLNDFLDFFGFIVTGQSNQ